VPEVFGKVWFSLTGDGEKPVQFSSSTTGTLWSPQNNWRAFGTLAPRTLWPETCRRDTRNAVATRGEHANTQFIWCKASQNNFDQICKFFLLQVIIDQELETLCICSLSMLSYDFWAGILIVWTGICVLSKLPGNKHFAEERNLSSELQEAKQQDSWVQIELWAQAQTFPEFWLWFLFVESWSFTPSEDHVIAWWTPGELLYSFYFLLSSLQGRELPKLRTRQCWRLLQIDFKVWTTRTANSKQICGWKNLVKLGGWSNLAETLNWDFAYVWLDSRLNLCTVEHQVIPECRKVGVKSGLRKRKLKRRHHRSTQRSIGSAIHSHLLNHDKYKYRIHAPFLTECWFDQHR
jgi:hypothetical protein